MVSLAHGAGRERFINHLDTHPSTRKPKLRFQVSGLEGWDKRSDKQRQKRDAPFP